MQPKKNPKVSLENKKGMFFQIGLAVTLLTILIAFEWKSYDKTNYNLGDLNLDDMEEEIIPITRQEVKPPPPPPPPSPPPSSSRLLAAAAAPEDGAPEAALLPDRRLQARRAARRQVPRDSRDLQPSARPEWQQTGHAQGRFGEAMDNEGRRALGSRRENPRHGRDFATLSTQGAAARPDYFDGAAGAGAEAGGEAEVSTAALADTCWVERRDAGEDAGA